MSLQISHAIMAFKTPKGLMPSLATKFLMTPQGRKSSRYLNPSASASSHSTPQYKNFSCTARTFSYSRRNLSTVYPERSVPSKAKVTGIYSGDLPDDLAIDPRLKSFYEIFYNVADNSSAHEAFAEAFFTEDATFILGSKEAQGRDQICDLRRSMWSGPVRSRQHTLLKIFPFGNRSNEIMVYGTCVYKLWNGRAVPVDWAARAFLEDEGSNLKMSYYQVYVDSMLVANAAKDD